MKLPVSWLRQFVDVPADPHAVAAKLGACGFAVESVVDDVIEFEITANRPDCLSVLGLAREASTAFNIPLTPSPSLTMDEPADTPVSVSIDDAACGRYALAVLDVKVGPSPDWLAARLRAAGVRPINNVVDVTNYVMLECGQPMHAFDVAKLAGPGIRVRRARPGEQLTTLDGETRALDETMLVIADRDRAVAVAGVMGGASSEVSGSTTRIALESAWFVPATVRATSKKLGLKTEASARFERGADIFAPAAGLLRAMSLLGDIGAGTPVGGVTDIYASVPALRRVRLNRTRVQTLLGQSIPDDEILRILRGLWFTPTADADGWDVDVPSFRVDVSRDADLVEEIGRHWGFDRIPSTFPALTAAAGASDPSVARGRLLRRVLCGAGLQEAVTFTFIEEASAAPYAPADDRVVITNPLSEKFASMRPSLAPGLADAVVYNLNRQAERVNLFEIGTVFSRSQGEHSAAGWAMTGTRGSHWSGGAGTVDFFDVKGVAALIGAALGVSIETGVDDDALTWLVRGQRASLSASGRHIGWVGRLQSVKGADDPIFAGELNLDAIAATASARAATIDPLPRFPAIVRDLSILVDERLPAADVRATIRSNAPPTLVDVHEFDRYQGKGVPPGRISLSVRLTFRDAQRTLTDAEVQPAVEAIVQALAREHGATLRGA